MLGHLSPPHLRSGAAMPEVKVEPSQSSQGSLLEVMDAEGLDTFVNLVQRQASCLVSCSLLQSRSYFTLYECKLTGRRGPNETKQDWWTPFSCCSAQTLSVWVSTFTSRCCTCNAEAIALASRAAAQAELCHRLQKFWPRAQRKAAPRMLTASSRQAKQTATSSARHAAVQSKRCLHVQNISRKYLPPPDIVQIPHCVLSTCMAAQTGTVLKGAALVASLMLTDHAKAMPDSMVAAVVGLHDHALLVITDTAKCSPALTMARTTLAHMNMSALLQLVSQQQASLDRHSSESGESLHVQAWPLLPAKAVHVV